MAAARGHAAICRLLIEAGADPALRDANGDDALSVAIKNCRTETEAVLRGYLSPPSAPAGGSAVGVVPSASRDMARSRSTAPPFSHEDRHLDQWDELIESEPPPDNPSVRTDATQLQNRISEHTPTDTDTDWSDIDIELPETSGRHHPERAEWLDGVRRLIDFGLSWGWVASRQVAEVAADGAARDCAEEIESRLRFVLGDVGIPVEEDPVPGWITNHSSFHDRPPADGHSALIDEAIIFLDDLSLARDPLTYYWKGIRQIEARASRELRRSRQ